jgi:anaerobic sulfite reductase subunit B
VALDGIGVLPAPFRVAERRRETHDTWTLRLQPAREDACPRFAPGQFAMLYAFGAGEAPISISRVDGDGLVHTIRAVGAVTEALCAADAVGVRGPFGTAWPLAQAEGRDVVVIAGGIGLAPLRPVVDALLADRGRYGEVNVLYGGRAPRELLYLDELQEWADRGDAVVETIVDVPDDDWRGPVGVVTKLIDRARFDPARTVVMTCGPEVMMRFAAAAMGDRGVSDGAILVSLERSMKCALGHCGHCQLRELFVCRDGPVFTRDVAAPLMGVPEL